ncbi:hypothetical protein MTR62_19340, partial [Novosphingobium sp. 1949]
MIQPNAPSLSASLSATVAAPTGLPGAQAPADGGFAQVLGDLSTTAPAEAANPAANFAAGAGAKTGANTGANASLPLPPSDRALPGKSPAADGNILPLAAAALPRGAWTGQESEDDETTDTAQAPGDAPLPQDSAETASLPEIVTFSPAFLAAIQFTLPVPPEAHGSGDTATGPVPPSTATLAYLPAP